MFINYGKLTNKWSKEQPVIKTRKELKIYLAKEEYKNLIVHDWSNNELMAVQLVRVSHYLSYFYQSRKV